MEGLVTVLEAQVPAHSRRRWRRGRSRGHRSGSPPRSGCRCLGLALAARRRRTGASSPAAPPPRNRRERTRGRRSRPRLGACGRCGGSRTPCRRRAGPASGRSSRSARPAAARRESEPGSARARRYPVRRFAGADLFGDLLSRLNLPGAHQHTAGDYGGVDHRAPGRIDEVGIRVTGRELGARAAEKQEIGGLPDRECRPSEHRGAQPAGDRQCLGRRQRRGVAAACFWLRAKSFTSSNMSRLEFEETPSVPSPIAAPAAAAAG